MKNQEISGGKEKDKVATPAAAARKKRANMHEGIGVWCDCCSCEAEPYWAELADEMGVDLSDYEDEYKPARRGGGGPGQS